MAACGADCSEVGDVVGATPAAGGAGGGSGGRGGRSQAADCGSARRAAAPLARSSVAGAVVRLPTVTGITVVVDQHRLDPARWRAGARRTASGDRDRPRLSAGTVRGDLDDAATASRPRSAVRSLVLRLVDTVRGARRRRDAPSRRPRAALSAGVMRLDQSIGSCFEPWRPSTSGSSPVAGATCRRSRCPPHPQTPRLVALARSPRSSASTSCGPARQIRRRHVRRPPPPTPRPTRLVRQLRDRARAARRSDRPSYAAAATAGSDSSARAVSSLSRAAPRADSPSSTRRVGSIRPRSSSTRTDRELLGLAAAAARVHQLDAASLPTDPSATHRNSSRMISRCRTCTDPNHRGVTLIGGSGGLRPMFSRDSGATPTIRRGHARAAPEPDRVPADHHRRRRPAGDHHRHRRRGAAVGLGSRVPVVAELLDRSAHRARAVRLATSGSSRSTGCSPVSCRSR